VIGHRDAIDPMFPTDPYQVRWGDVAVHGVRRVNMEIDS
jgi:hypothetical protein